MGGPRPPAETSDSYFPPQPQDNLRPGPFHRRPTNLSLKAAKKVAKEGDDGVGAFVNLEGGLAITLNLEVNSKDPSGITVPYKLLVPALRFESDGYDPPATHVAKGWKKWLKMRRKKKPQTYIDDGPASDEDLEADPHDQDDEYDDEDQDDADYEGYPGSDEEEEDDDDGHRQPSGPHGHNMVLNARRPRKKWFGVI